ncbi:glycosyltransferase family 2 protein, partial [Candidatus Roizmanbacteria bacterium]|nr:glycosyltransferase family 2 protein [Candidatus Roizmanbacteria bacterium]
MPKSDLSIIIVSYNTKDITKNCIESILNSLKKTRNQAEIIVIDNGSTDGSLENIKYQISNSKNTYQKSNITFKLIENKENLGFGKANNQGVNVAESDYIIFLNSDILVLDDAINNLYTFYRQNENTINFLGGKLLNEDLTPQPSCGPFYSLLITFIALFLRGDYLGFTRYSPKQAKEVDWVSGACILTKKQYLKSIKGFDENIFMYMDEIDLLYRAKKQGYRVFFYPKAEFIHLGSASSGERKYPILQVFKGLSYFYKKHH